jgi:hypothetical protein
MSQQTKSSVKPVKIVLPTISIPDGIQKGGIWTGWSFPFSCYSHFLVIPSSLQTKFYKAWQPSGHCVWEIKNSLVRDFIRENAGKSGNGARGDWESAENPMQTIHWERHGGTEGWMEASGNTWQHKSSSARQRGSSQASELSVQLPVMSFSYYPCLTLSLAKPGTDFRAQLVPLVNYSPRGLYLEFCWDHFYASFVSLTITSYCTSKRMYLIDPRSQPYCLQLFHQLQLILIIY